MKSAVGQRCVQQAKSVLTWSCETIAEEKVNSVQLSHNLLFTPWIVPRGQMRTNEAKGTVGALALVTEQQSSQLSLDKGFDDICGRSPRTLRPQLIQLLNRLPGGMGPSLALVKPGRPYAAS